MKARIHTQAYTLTSSIQYWIDRQVERNLQRFEGEVLAVEVYLSDLNGPRGGDDNRVVMRASLRGLPSVTVITDHQDLYVAVSRSARRLQRAVKRSLRKSRRVEPRKVLALRRQTPEMV